MGRPLARNRGGGSPSWPRDRRITRRPQRSLACPQPNSSPLACRGDCCQRARRQYHNPAPLKQNQVLPLPQAQLLVRAFSGYADDFTEVTLGQCNPATARCVLGLICQFEEGLGQSARQIEEHDVLKLLTGMPKASTQQLDELDREFRLFLNQRPKISSFDHHQLAVGNGCCICRPLKPVKQRDLAEYRTRGDQIEHSASVTRRCRTDLYGSRTNSKKAGSRVASCEDRGTSLNRVSDHIRTQCVKQFRLEPDEQRMIAKDRTLIESPASGFLS